MKTSRTRSQERILKLLETLKRATSAQDLYMELHQRNDSMGLATVYRSLEALKLDGAVKVRTLPSGEALYSLSQEDRHHLTCLQCGASVPIQECPVYDLERRLQEAYQFKIFYHTLEFFGLCTQCHHAQAVEVESAQ